MFGPRVDERGAFKATTALTKGFDTAEEDAEKVDKDRMKCNSPRRTSGGSKKFVVKACKDGKEKIVRFGDPNMKIKKRKNL